MNKICHERLLFLVVLFLPFLFLKRASFFFEQPRRSHKTSTPKNHKWQTCKIDDVRRTSSWRRSYRAESYVQSPTLEEKYPVYNCRIAVSKGPKKIMQQNMQREERNMNREIVLIINSNRINLSPASQRIRHRFLTLKLLENISIRWTSKPKSPRTLLR